MIDFSLTTPFELVRRLAAAGKGSASVYLLIAEDADAAAVQSDMSAEIQVQLGANLRSLAASKIRPEGLQEAFRADAAWPVVLIIMDRWAPKLIDSLDCNVVLMTGVGTVLLLANNEIAERVLTAAPNLRNRLTDVLAVGPDQAFGGTPA
jgi:hypothetical protein